MPPRLVIPTLEEVSKHFAPVASLKKIRGPYSLRRLLRTASGQPVSQAQLGRLLARYRLHGYSGSTLSIWERSERCRRYPQKYVMADQARAAYQSLIIALVKESSQGRLMIRARLGKRVWHLRAVTHCHRCTRTFFPRSIRTRYCARCRRR